MSVTATGKRGGGVTPKLPTLVTFDLAHWVKHLENIQRAFADGYEDCVYAEFAWDLVRTLGWKKYEELTRNLSLITGGFGHRVVFEDDDGYLWLPRNWIESASDTEDLIEVYRILGWEQSILFNHWYLNNVFAIEDHDGTLPPRSPVCDVIGNSEPDCLVHPRSAGIKGVEVIELPHGPACPDHIAVTPSVTATGDEGAAASVTPSAHRCGICNGEFRGRADTRYCSGACRQKAYRRRASTGGAA